MASSNGWHRKGTTEADRARKRQYNSREHRARRAAGQREVDAGDAHCWRCGKWIPPGSYWHLGHDDHDRRIYRGVECPPCNLGAAARKANAMRRDSDTEAPAVRRSRDW